MYGGSERQKHSDISQNTATFMIIEKVGTKFLVLSGQNLSQFIVYSTDTATATR